MVRSRAVMLQLRVYGDHETLAAVGHELEQDGMARHLAVTPGLRAGSAVLTGEVSPDAAAVATGRATLIPKPWRPCRRDITRIA